MMCCVAGRAWVRSVQCRAAGICCGRCGVVVMSIRESERTLGETLLGSGGICASRVGCLRFRGDAGHHLTLVEREEISLWDRGGLTARSIARRDGRPSSRVSRGIARNGGRDACRALPADAAAFNRARCLKVSKLAGDAELAGLVAAKLDDDWSPQQIAQWLRREHPVTPRCRSRTNPSTVMCYPPSRNAFGARMFHRLRSDRPIRRRRGRRCLYGRGQIRNPVFIRERPRRG